jgi:hypothetical protein
MRGRRLNMPAIGRVAGFALVAAAIVATAVSFRHGAGGGPTAASRVVLTADPLAAAPCEAAWAENRGRFFTGGAKAGGAAAVSVADAAGAQTHSAKAR